MSYFLNDGRRRLKDGASPSELFVFHSRSRLREASAASQECCFSALHNFFAAMLESADDAPAVLPAQVAIWTESITSLLHFLCVPTPNFSLCRRGCGTLGYLAGERRSWLEIELRVYQRSGCRNMHMNNKAALTPTAEGHVNLHVHTFE